MLTASPQAIATSNILKTFHTTNWIVGDSDCGITLLFVDFNFTAGSSRVLKDLSIWRCNPGGIGEEKMTERRWNVAKK
jgi:hypothetical protein